MCMKRRSFLGTSAALVAGSMLSRPDLHAEAGSAHHLHAASLMTECANRFLASLEPNQRGRATFAFEADERTNWHYIPANTKIAADQLGERKGLPLFDMSPYQKHLASALLAAGLSQTGLIKALTIMSLEEVLQVMEGDNGSHRNPEKYYVSVFGTPSDTQAWGYRVEGHHLSQNFTVVNGTAVNGPSFFGANPAEVRQGPRKGLRALAREDDLGSEVIRALDEQQQKVAIVSAAAYDEILTGASRKAALQGQPSGLSAAKMNARQFDGLMTLIGEYAHNVPGELAAGRIEQVNRAGRNIYFAWSGGIKPGDAHYYRIQTPSFLIEFDDTQNNANHIHTVWRNFTGDFGEDLLGSHYRAGHEQSR
jgi:Protein of unknown function (DUF3500)